MGCGRSRRRGCSRKGGTCGLSRGRRLGADRYAGGARRLRRVLGSGDQRGSVRSREAKKEEGLGWGSERGKDG